MTFDRYLEQNAGERMYSRTAERAGHGRPSACVLLNLGGPESPTGIPRSIRSLLGDPRWCRLPWPRCARLLAGAVIARRRGAGGQQHYAAIGGRARFDAQTRAQAEALARALGEGFRVRFAFRHSAAAGRTRSWARCWPRACAARGAAGLPAVLALDHGLGAG